MSHLRVALAKGRGSRQPQHGATLPQRPRGSLGHRETSDPPLQKSAVETPGRNAGSAQDLDRLIGIDAIRSAAARDHFLSLRNLLQPTLQLADGNADGSGEVARRVLVGRAHIQDKDSLLADPLAQLVPRHRLQAVPSPIVLLYHPTDFGHVVFGHPPQGADQADDIRIGEGVDHLRADLPALDQAAPAQLLEMLGGVPDRQAGSLRQPLHAAIALSKDIEQLEAMTAAERSGDQRELFERQAFGPTRAHALGRLEAKKFIQYSIDHWNSVAPKCTVVKSLHKPVPKEDPAAASRLDAASMKATSAAAVRRPLTRAGYCSWTLLLSSALGVVNVAGFAPFYVYAAPILALALLLRLWRRRTPAVAAAIGFAYGLGLFGAGVSWVYISLHDYGGMPVPLAVLVTVAFVCFLAAPIAVIGYVQARVPAGDALRFILLVPGLWVLAEWVRSWLLTGFPWLSVGYSQVPASPLAGFGPVLGVLGMSLAATLSAGLLGLLVWGGADVPQRRKRRDLWCFLLLGLWVTGLGFSWTRWSEPAGPPLRVSLVQGNVAQDVKWLPEQVQRSLETYRQLIAQSEGRLIILPETALPLFWSEVPQSYLRELAGRAKHVGGDLLIGVPECAADGRYFNSLASLGSGPPQIYRKHHLVPFGEYVPARPLLGWIVDKLQIPLSDLSRGAGDQVPLAVAGQKLAVLICFEDAFGSELVGRIRDAT